MSKFICKQLLRLRSSVRIWHCRGTCFFQIQPCSTSGESVGNSQKQQFGVTYLINSCGCPPEEALSVSRYVKFEAPEKPDSVLAFLEKYGFTKTQIRRLVRLHPPVLLSDPDKTLLPKLEFFKSKGMSTADVTRILARSPRLFKRSLVNQIIPTFMFFNDLLQSEEKIISLLKRSAEVLLFDPETRVRPNIEILRETGVPNKHISAFLTKQPRKFVTSSLRFREIVEEVKKMGFNPLTMKFVDAVHAMRSMTNSTWKRKLDAYRKWGWAEEDTLAAFVRHPWCMVLSEDKITRVMDYLVNKMGLDSSLVARRPIITCYSLEGRVIPRCTVYKVLVSKGLIKDSDSRLLAILNISEELMLKLLNSHKKEAPELLKLYEEKLALAE